MGSSLAVSLTNNGAKNFTDSLSSQVRDELNHEALQFIKEQRIRCLLAGAWFPHSTSLPESGPVTKQTINRTTPSSWRFVRLSHNRRYLHYADFDEQRELEPTLEELDERSEYCKPPPSRLELTESLVDLSIVSSVVSNVSASPPGSAHSSTSTLKQKLQTKPAKALPSTSTKITIHGYIAPQSSNEETVLLQLHPQTHILASEWLDGLLMLLNQQPITADTNKLVNLIEGYGLKIRLLNVRFDELGAGIQEPAMPSREGLDEEYYYDIGGMEAGG
jgi:engulfment/cell motility protein 1